MHTGDNAKLAALGGALHVVVVLRQLHRLVEAAYGFVNLPPSKNATTRGVRRERLNDLQIQVGGFGD